MKFFIAASNKIYNFFSIFNFFRWVTLTSSTRRWVGQPWLRMSWVEPKESRTGKSTSKWPKRLWLRQRGSEWLRRRGEGGYTFNPTCKWQIIFKTRKKQPVSRVLAWAHTACLQFQPSIPILLLLNSTSLQLLKVMTCDNFFLPVFLQSCLFRPFLSGETDRRIFR